MHRFFCTTLAPSGNTLTLGRDETHHARKVLRLDPGDIIGLLDGKGGVGEGVIDSWVGGEAIVRVTHARQIPSTRPRIVVATAIPKGPRAQDMVDQLSQVGVARFIPLIAERSTVDPGEGKLERFERTVLESAKQCARAWVMEVGKAAEPKTILAEPHDVKLIAAPGGESIGVNLAAKLAPAASVLILIGPEGGWTDEELLLADAAGATRWSFGPHVMRIETAAIAAGAIAAYLTR